jgi:hypothetical protein
MSNLMSIKLDIVNYIA